MKPDLIQHVSPALRVLAGADSLDHLSRELARLSASRAVIVCGRSMAASDLVELAESAMQSRCAGVVVRAQAHSPRDAVEATAEDLKRLNADAVIAIGGGSAVVTARAASILLGEPKDVAALSSHIDDTGRLISPRLDAPKLPNFVVPTTPNTAIVKAGSAVFDPHSGRRLALFDPKTRAQAIFIHPQFLMSAPRDLVIAASLDTLTLAVEGLLSHQGDPIADGLLIHAIRLLFSSLDDVVSNDSDEVRTSLAMAAVLCGRGTDHTGAGVATVIGHAIGANHGLDNGIAKAIVLPEVLQFNESFVGDGLAKVAVAIGLTNPDDHSTGRIVDAFQNLFGKLGIPSRLSDLGLPHDALGDVAALCMEDWFLRGNPRPVADPADIVGVLDAAW